MAISPMNRVSLLAPNQRLDDLLRDIQELRQVQIIDLQDMKEWESVTAESIELIENYEMTDQAALTDQEILQDLERRASQIERAIHIIEDYVPQASLWERLTKGRREVSYRQIEYNGAQYDEQEMVNHILNATERLHELEVAIEERRDQADDLYRWRNLEITPNELRRFEYVRGMIGSIPSTNEDQFINFVKNHDDLEMQTVFIDEYDYGVIIFAKDLDKSEVFEELHDYHFTPFKYTSNLLPEQRYQELEQEIKAARQEISDIREDLRNSESTLRDLQLQYEYVANMTARERAKLSMGRSQHLIAIQGWIEADRAPAFQQLIQDEYQGQVVVKILPIETVDYDYVPTKLKNNALVRPFEMLTKMYGIPNYAEVDPTPFVMPFYFIFFGMMLADLGYGLLIVLLTGIPLLKFRLPSNTRETVKLAHFLGWSTVFWGIIYGSFFGATI